MTTLLRATLFVGVRSSVVVLRWLRTGLAACGLGFLVLIAMDPGPVAREVARRVRALRHTFDVAEAPVLTPLTDAPPIHWPVDAHRVSSGFGLRIHPITGRTQDHRGIDLPLPSGSPVRAARPGRVTRVAEDGLNGLHLVLEEEETGLRFAYAHLSAVDTTVGSTVQAGEVLARSGNTGRSTGPHLHFGAWRDGRPVDPRRFRSVGAGAGSLALAAP